jgi:hypothetical protein
MVQLLNLTVSIMMQDFPVHKRAGMTEIYLGENP